MSSGAQPPLAHSAPDKGRAPQIYADHSTAVRTGARARAEAMLRYAARSPAGFADAVEAAGAFHDLGKLDPANQAALRQGRKASLPWDHIDAGVAHLSDCGSGLAAWLVRAHHAPGLPSCPKHFDRDGLGRRLRGRRNDENDQDEHDKQIERTRVHLPDLLAAHASVVGPFSPAPSKVSHGLEMRLALSCLVDADHSNTAHSDTGLPPPQPLEPRWAERLDRLDAYVAGLPPSGNAERDRHRRGFYRACRDSRLNGPFVTCEGPVGIGKTTAVTAYLLRRAQAEGLRRLVVVAPYTNIISQTATTLRQALTLPGEAPEEVVAEHHHRADFGSREARELAVTWSAPVVVTTAVQLFETLAANTPAALRKLHALPGSAIFLDEAHAALPAHLWPQNWLWLGGLARRWGCRVVLASGSLIRFWENAGIIEKPERLEDLLDDELRRSILSAERRRISYKQAGRFETVSALVKAIADQPGPRLVILNTVQSAAVVARAMRRTGCDVLHISTAIAPKDRAPLLQLVSEKLKTPPADWTLVATSCVEAGVDLSFRTALRERFSITSLVQTGGRVNRHGEGTIGTVFDFLIDATEGITAHPGARDPAKVLGRLLQNGVFVGNQHDPAALVSEAMADEIRERGGLGENALRQREEERDYPSVAKLGRVIDADTRTVVIDPILAERIKRREHVTFRNLLSGSVQLWANRVEALRLPPLHEGADAFCWPYDYDPTFLGVMEGILRLSDLDSQGIMMV